MQVNLFTYSVSLSTYIYCKCNVIKQKKIAKTQIVMCVRSELHEVCSGQRAVKHTSNEYKCKAICISCRTKTKIIPTIAAGAAAACVPPSSFRNHPFTLSSTTSTSTTTITPPTIANTIWDNFGIIRCRYITNDCCNKECIQWTSNDIFGT